MAISASNVRNAVFHLSLPGHHHYLRQQHHHLLHCHHHHRHGSHHLHHHQQQQQQQHHHGHRRLLYLHQHQMRAMRGKEEEELLWEDLFSKPSRWLDYRRRKRTPSHPDFRHKTSRTPLWLNSLYKPHWVDPRLAVPGPDTPHEENLLCNLCRKGELNMAMEALSDMDRNGFTPSDTLYISLLKACHKSKSLFHAIHVHGHVLQHRMQLAEPLRDALIITLAKCGSLDDAHALLHTVPHCTAYSWTAVIAGYLERGRGHDALDTFSYMQEIEVGPNYYTFASLIKACSSVCNLEEGRKFHAHARSKGFTLTPSIGTALVKMYSKCGSILEAEGAFEELPQRDVSSWNTMLSVYLEHGFGDKALLAYRQMQEERENSDALTYVIVLRACGFLGEEESFSAPNSTAFLLIGRALHADMRRSYFASDVLLRSALVTMYGKCGSISEAMSALEELSGCDIASWSALLSLYVQQGQGVKALLVFKKLQEEGSSPDVHMYVTSLRACIILIDKEEATSIVALEIGKALHEDAQCKGLASDVFFGNTLVSLYGKCGSIARAEIVFNGLCHCDVVSWNAILSVYIQHGQGAKVLCLYRQMLVEGVSADMLTFVICFQACGILAEHETLVSKYDREAKLISLQVGQALHAFVRKKGYCSSALVCNALISMYGKCRSLVEAENVFSSFECDVVSWNSMLSAYVENGKGGRSLQLYNRMQEGFEHPNKLTYVIALQACNALTEEEGQSCEVMGLEIGRALHVDLWMKDFLSDVVVGSTLVSMYGNCGAVEDAESVFDKMLHRNLVLWNSMLSAYVEQGHEGKALHLYSRMEEDGMPIDEITLVCALQACSKTGSFEMCGQLHFRIVSVGFGSSPNLVNTLIHTYGHCASRMDAQAVFFELSQPDQVAWNAWIASHAQEGSFGGSLSVFQNMQMADIGPDGITYLSLLYSCSHAGLVEKGLKFLESLSRDCHLSPDIKHYVVMIDLLGRTGNFKKLEHFLLRMPMQANLRLWLCLLGACRMHGNLGLGKEAFKHAMDLQPGDAAAYVLLSNIYANGCLKE